MAENDQTTMQTQLDVMDTPIIIPASKLDADQYSVDDLDGVTESIFGSGNMAYASLQASQTDAALDMNDTAPLLGNNNLNFNNQVPYSSDGGSYDASAFNTDNTHNNHGNAPLDTDRSIDHSGSGDSGGGNGNFASATVGSLSASQLSSDAGSFAPAGSGLSLSDGLDGDVGSDGARGNGNVNAEASPSADGSDGQDGSDGVNVEIGDVPIVNIDLGDTVIMLDTILTDLGDTITTLMTSVTNVTDVLGDVLTSIIDNPFDINNTLNQVTNLSENITETLSNTLTEITNITNVLEDALGGLGDLTLSLDLNVLDTGVLGIDVPMGDLLDTDIDLDVNLAPTYELANSIADLAGLDILGDTLAELGGVVELAQSTIDKFSDVVSDVDLHDPGASVAQLLDTLDNLDATLADVTNVVDDAVGGILDDLGIGAGAGHVLDDATDGIVEATGAIEGSADELSDIVDTLSENLINGIIGDHDNNANENGDGDLTVNVLGVDEELNVSLDPVEDLAGDIDLSLDLGLFGDSETDNNANDQDIIVETGIDFVDNTVVSQALDVPLDNVENVVGDVDLNIGTAVNLLSDNAGNLVNDGDGGTGDDVVLAHLGDALGDAAQGALSGDAGGLQGGVTDAVEAVTGATDDLALEAAEDMDAAITALDGLFQDVMGDEDSLENDMDAVPDTGIELDFVDQEIVGEVSDSAINIVEDIVNEVDAAADLLDVAQVDMDAGDNVANMASELNSLDTDVLDLAEPTTGGTETVNLDSASDLVEDVAGEADTGLGLNTDLLSSSETTSDADESTLNPEMQEAVEEGADIPVDMSLDPSENLTDDIDLDINAALDLFNVDISETEESGGSDDDGNWTESTITDGGGIFDDLANDTDGLGDALPDPAGTVAEGIGVLDVEPELDVSSVGGLFG